MSSFQLGNDVFVLCATAPCFASHKHAVLGESGDGFSLPSPNFPACALGVIPLNALIHCRHFSKSYLLAILDSAPSFFSLSASRCHSFVQTFEPG